MTQQLENVQNQSQRKDYECSKLQEKSQQLKNEVDEMRRQKEIVETQLREMEQQLLWKETELKPKTSESGRWKNNWRKARRVPMIGLSAVMKFK